MDETKIGLYQKFTVRRTDGINPTDFGWCPTLEGGHIVSPGDWIIKGVKGEFYPIKNDIFLETYEPA